MTSRSPAEILGGQRFRDWENSRIARCFIAVSAIFVVEIQEVHGTTIGAGLDEVGYMHAWTISKAAMFVNFTTLASCHT